MILTIVVPGEPVAQGRPRAFYRPGIGVRTYDPQKSRLWKGVAQSHYQQALAEASVKAPAFTGPVQLEVLAIFACPRSRWRKQHPRSREPKTGRPDPDNIAKAVMDAGNGLLWLDDAQVSRLVVERVVGAQGEAPRVIITVAAFA